MSLLTIGSGHVPGAPVDVIVLVEVVVNDEVVVKVADDVVVVEKVEVVVPVTLVVVEVLVVVEEVRVPIWALGSTGATMTMSYAPLVDFSLTRCAMVFWASTSPRWAERPEERRTPRAPL